MADSILDYLTNNWQSLLGSDAMPGMSSPSSAPPAPPPAAAMPQGGSYAPGSPLGTSMLGPGNPTGAPLIAPPSPQQNMNMAQAGFPTNTTPAPNPAMPDPGQGPNGVTMTTAPNMATPPLPQPRPPGAPNANPPPMNQTLANMQPGANGSPSLPPPLNIAPDQNQFLPSHATPTTMPPSSAMNGGPAPSSTGSLAASLGLNPTVLKNAMGGLGQGLSQVGKMRQGTPAGQAFAAGAGGALEGTDKAENQTFAQSSQAFKDMMLAKSQGDNEAYKQAQAKYLSARATSIANGGGPNGAGVMNSPEQKSLRIENYVNQQQRSMQSMLQKQWSMNNASPEKQADDLANMQKELQAYRNRLYKTAGIDPAQADDLVNRGTDKKNPFDTKNMTLDHFNQSVPMGAWFKDQNGVVRQRTVPPGGDQTPQSNNAAPPGAGGDYMADQMAMQPPSSQAIQ